MDTIESSSPQNLKNNNQKLLPIIVKILLLGLFSLPVTAWLYFSKYPELVTMDAYNSVIAGNDIVSLFELENDFMKALSSNKAIYSSFKNVNHSAPCLMLELRRNSTNAKLVLDVGQKDNVIWSGSRERVPEALLNEVIGKGKLRYWD